MRIATGKEAEDFLAARTACPQTKDGRLGSLTVRGLRAAWPAGLRGATSVQPNSTPRICTIVAGPKRECRTPVGGRRRGQTSASIFGPDESVLPSRQSWSANGVPPAWEA